MRPRIRRLHRAAGLAGSPDPEKFEPSGYALKRLAQERAALERVRRLTTKECDALSKVEWDKECLRHKQAIERKQQLRARYESMLAEVEKWTPPTPDHVELKKFMARQITESIAFDCDDHDASVLERLLRDGPYRGEVWRTKRIALHEEAVQSATESHNQDIQRAKNRTDWVRKLRASLQ